METIAVVLEAAGADRAQSACFDSSDRRRRRRRCRVERRQHRHRAIAVVGPDAAVSGHGISAGARLRVGRACRRSGIGHRSASWPARLRSRREMFRRGARPVRRVGLAPGGAGKTRGAARSEPRRSRHPAGAGGDRLSRHRGAGASAPDCIVGHGVLGRLLARISIALRNEPPTVWEKNPARVGGAVDYGVIDPEHDTAPRLQEHLRCQRRCGPARFPDRPHRARRRDRAGRLLQRAAVLCVPAGLHARGAASRRRRMATVRSRRDHGR